MIKKKIIITGISGLVAIGFLSASTASADSITGNKALHSRSGVIGVVSSVSGSSITLLSKDRQATSTFAIDATNATVMKAGATSTISAIQAGDMLLVRGAVSGTNVVAEKIIDGLPQMNSKPAGRKNGHASSTASINGRPAFGSVSAVNGSSFTIQEKSFGKRASSTGATPALVTINTDGTTVFKKNGNAASIADIQTGVSVMAFGIKDAAGTSITAKQVDIVTASSTGKKGMAGFGPGKKGPRQLKK